MSATWTLWLAEEKARREKLMHHTSSEVRLPCGRHFSIVHAVNLIGAAESSVLETLAFLEAATTDDEAFEFLCGSKWRMDAVCRDLEDTGASPWRLATLALAAPRGLPRGRGCGHDATDAAPLLLSLARSSSLCTVFVDSVADAAIAAYLQHDLRGEGEGACADVAAQRRILDKVLADGCECVSGEHGPYEPVNHADSLADVCCRLSAELCHRCEVCRAAVTRSVADMHVGRVRRTVRSLARLFPAPPPPPPPPHADGSAAEAGGGSAAGDASPAGSGGAGGGSGSGAALASAAASAAAASAAAAAAEAAAERLRALDAAVADACQKLGAERAAVWRHAGVSEDGRGARPDGSGRWPATPEPGLGAAGGSSGVAAKLADAVAAALAALLPAGCACRAEAPYPSSPLLEQLVPEVVHLRRELQRSLEESADRASEVHAQIVPALLLADATLVTLDPRRVRAGDEVAFYRAGLARVEELLLDASGWDGGGGGVQGESVDDAVRCVKRALSVMHRLLLVRYQALQLDGCAGASVYQELFALCEAHLETVREVEQRASRRASGRGSRLC